MLLDFYPPYTYRGTWNSATQYQTNDLVTVSTTLYLARKDSLNKDPSTSPDDWGTAPYTYASIWSSGTTYVRDSAVLSNGRLFYAPTAPSSSIDYSTRQPGMTLYPWVQVSGTRNTLISDIRDLVLIGLDSSDLPDDTIIKNVFFRASELTIIERLGLTMEAYTEKLATDPGFRERVQIAVERRTAAAIIPALPQVVEEAILNQRWRYLEIDWQERISLLLRQADEAIVDDLVSVQGAIYGVASRYVGF